MFNNSTLSTADNSSRQDLQMRTLLPAPRTLYGPGFLYQIPLPTAVVVGDVVNKVFDNQVGAGILTRVQRS